MGSGKSFWAKQLAKKMKISAYDLDQLITAAEEKTINEIFEASGEDYFRKAESTILKWFKDKKTFILAVGGGTPCYNNNMQWMNTQGITIWLDEPVETLHKRLLLEKQQRPLIKNLDEQQLLDFLITKREERLPFYNQAKHHVSGDQINEVNLIKIMKQYA